MPRPNNLSASPTWYSPAKAGVLELEHFLNTLRQQLAAVISKNGHPDATVTRPEKDNILASASCSSADTGCAGGIHCEPEQSPKLEETTCSPGTTLLETGQVRGLQKLRNEMDFVNLQLLSTQRALARLLEHNRRAIAQKERAARSLSLTQQELNVLLRRYDEASCAEATAVTPSETTARKATLAALASVEAFGKFCERAVDGSDSDFDRAVAILKTAIALKRGRFSAGLK